MDFESQILAPVTRRTFMKGMGAVAASMALPQMFMGREAEARVATSNGIRMIRFAHLTDLHFTTRKQNRYPTSHVHIKRAVADLNAQDLDFVLFTGDMFHYPEDIEATVSEITGGRVAAIAIEADASEKLVTVIEYKKRGTDEEFTERVAGVRNDVTAAISRAHGLNVADLVLVAPGSIPTTTSGKIRRAACVEQYRRQAFARLDA